MYIYSCLRFETNPKLKIFATPYPGLKLRTPNIMFLCNDTEIVAD